MLEKYTYFPDTACFYLWGEPGVRKQGCCYCSNIWCWSAEGLTNKQQLKQNGSSRSRCKTNIRIEMFFLFQSRMLEIEPLMVSHSSFSFCCSHTFSHIALMPCGNDAQQCAIFIFCKENGGNFKRINQVEKCSGFGCYHPNKWSLLKIIGPIEWLQIMPVGSVDCYHRVNPNPDLKVIPFPPWI